VQRQPVAARLLLHIMSDAPHAHANNAGSKGDTSATSGTPTTAGVPSSSAPALSISPLSAAAAPPSGVRSLHVSYSADSEAVCDACSAKMERRALVVTTSAAPTVRHHLGCVLDTLLTSSGSGGGGGAVDADGGVWIAGVEALAVVRISHCTHIQAATGTHPL
jgi:hypothetical protein